jgi:hypothetical protein
MKWQGMTDGQVLGYLLGQFGEDKMTREEFWRQMQARGFTQDHIDRWCDEFYQLEAKKDEDNARREEAKGRTTRGAVTRDARGEDRSQREGTAPRQGESRREGQGQREAAQAREESGGEVQDQAQWPRPVALPSDAELHAEAKRRYERDAETHPNHRPIAVGAEPYGHWLAGLMGEREFARAFNRPMNMELLPSGDGHIDFALPFLSRDGVVRNKVVDLKCNTFGGPGECMLVEVVELRPGTIYVLANYNGFSTSLLGWMVGDAVGQYPQRTLKGRDILNHAVPVDELRPMGKLLALYRPAEE